MILLFVVSALAVIPMSTALASAPVQPATTTAPAPLTGFKPTGALPSSLPVYVEVGIPLRNLAELQSLEQEISTPGSPLYDHFITQAQVEQEFLPTAQYNQAISFLTGHGFSIVTSSLDSTIVAEGTVAQASNDLGLRFEAYSNGTTGYYTAYGSSPLPGDYIYSSNITAMLLARPPDLVTVQNSATPSPRQASPSQVNQSAPIEVFPMQYLQTVYNSTGLLNKGIDGNGYVAGIIDFDGDPYIAQSLQAYDQAFGLQAPPQLNVIGIPPYNPGLGVEEGWDVEISLDVEAVHTMAPGASIDLYYANNALPLSAAVGPVVQADKVNVISQSFGIPEVYFSTPDIFGGLVFNVILPDQYYLLGSAEGISSISSSSDSGGSGDSGGPLGTASYPSTSPYVTSLGGTTTYFDFNGEGQIASFEQTAWSSYGYVPYHVNSGGSTGGVSLLEPLPWYQSGITVPASFPDGRLTPDVALDASVYPGVFIVSTGNVTYIVGGTSVASPLMAGLLTLVIQSNKGPLGLLNPLIYDMAESSSLYTKVFDPITFGYTIPWTAESGYNLVTGWGALNIGELAHYATKTIAPQTLGVNISTSTTNQFEFNPGQTLDVTAQITSGSLIVSTGTFTAQLDTLAGSVANVPLSFNAKTDTWDGTITIPTKAAGITYVYVQGTSNGQSGSGSDEIFTGYVAQFFSPGPDEPYSSEFGTPIAVNITDLAGDLITNGSYSVSVQSYSITNNTYRDVATVPLTFGSTELGPMWVGNLTGTYPNGPMVFSVTGGAYGYMPFINGVSMQTSFIQTPVFAMPGAVAAGDPIFIAANLVAPLNTPPIVSTDTGEPISYDLTVGSNVTASLVNQAGIQVASTTLYYNSFTSSTPGISGLLTVPKDAKPGLYDVILNSNFYSANLGGSISGSYFGQVYVSASESVPTVSMTPTAVYQGQTVTISAKITYSNGTDVKFGMYSALIMPKALQNFYPTLSGDVFVGVDLWYDTQTGLWTGYAILPSAYNLGGSSLNIDALYNSGPFVISVTGLSADGVPTTTSTSAQYAFSVQPYLYVSSEKLASSLPQPSSIAFWNDTISAPITLTGDLLLGPNTIEGGTATILDSQINGTLTVTNADLTLVGVSGGNIIAQNSKITLDDSSLSSIQLTNSQVSLNASSLGHVTPSLPTISVQSPVANENFNGTSGSLTVSGQDVSSVSVYLDGTLLVTLPGGSSPYTFNLASSKLQDGIHILEVVATQSDGLSSSDSIYFSTNGQLSAAQTQLSSASTQLSSDNTQLSSDSTAIGGLQSSLSTATASIGTLGSQLGAANATIGTLGANLSAASTQIGSLNSKLNSDNNTITGLTNDLYLVAGVAVVALIVGIAAMARKGSPRSQSPPPPTTSTGSAPSSSGASEPPPQSAPAA